MTMIFTTSIPASLSVDGFGRCVGGGRAGGVELEEREFLFVGEGGVEECLDAVGAGRGEFDVEEEADVVGDSAGRDLEERRLGEHDGVLSVVGEYAHLRHVSALAAPLADDGELQNRHGELLDDYLVEDAHQRKLVSDLKPHVVAEERV